MESVLFYLGVFFISTFCIAISNKYDKNKIIKYFFVIVGLGVIIFIAALRYNVGTDYNNYYKLYNLYHIKDLKNLVNQELEIGFMILIKIASNYNVLLFLTSLITIIIIYISIQNQSDKLIVSLAFFCYLCMFFPVTLNIMRQGISIAIVAFGYKYIYEKNLKKFLLCILFASAFHISALIMLPIYFVCDLKKIEKNKLFSRKQIIALVIIFIAILLFENLLNIMLKFSFFNKYKMYIHSTEVGSNRQVLFKIAVMLIFIYPIYKKLIIYNDKSKMYIFFLIIDIILTIIGFISPFMKRISCYFDVSIIYILAMIPKIVKKNQKITFILGISTYAIIYFIVMFYILRMSEVIPYNFIGGTI